MITRLGIALVLVLVPAAVVACGAVGEKLSVGSNPITSDGGDAEASAAPGEYADPYGDGGVVLFETQFEGPDECAEWKATGATVTTVPGRTGNGCMICATTNEENMFIRRDVANLPQLETGFYALSYYSKVVTANGQPLVGGTLALDDEDGGPPLSSNWDGDAAGASRTPIPGGGSPSSSAWQGGGSMRGIWEKRPGTILGAYFIASATTITPESLGPFLPPGTCVAFDDLKVTFTAASL